MPTALVDHQAVLAEMLADFDAVCRQYNISYMLFAGTALGAVRHHGFIPWDDDVDVIMLREDYDRFFAEAAPALDPQKYYVQKEFSAHWPMFFSKLRKNHTACIEKFHPKDPQMHQGIFLDIFPADNLYDNPLLRRLQYYASKIVIAKSLDRRGYETDSAGKKAMMLLCRCLPMRPFLRFAQNRKGTGSAQVHSFFGASKAYEKSVFPREWFTQTAPCAFGAAELPVSAYADALLTTLYGDYMRLPSEEERRFKRHTVLVDLQKDYTEYLAYQKEMKIQSYTGSIR